MGRAMAVVLDRYPNPYRTLPKSTSLSSTEGLLDPIMAATHCIVVFQGSVTAPLNSGTSLHRSIYKGENPKKPGAPHNVRLYSIASKTYGDSFDEKTASLCVKRAVYYDPETGKEDPSKNGVFSTFLCDSKRGDKVKITGSLLNLIANNKIEVLHFSNPQDFREAIFVQRYKFERFVKVSNLCPTREIPLFFTRKMCRDGKTNTRILFCGPHFPASNNYTKEYLQNYPSIQVDDLPFDSVPDNIKNYDICVVKSMRLTSDLIARATRMKLIMQYGVGLDGVDIPAATNHGIKVARIPSVNTGNAASCAEMAIYFMLCLLRKQNEIQIAVRQKKLGEPVGDTLQGKTVFILGFGNIGIELAKRLRPFGVKIVATKRNWASKSTESDLIDEKGCHEDIYEFAKISDIIACCLSMNSETAGTINKKFVSSMKKGGLLVNIARGGLTDYEAVYNGLKSGHVGGLGADVAWTEPFDPDDPILKFQNVLLTPHVAGITEPSFRSMAKIVGDVAIQLQSGKPLTGIEFVN